MADDKKRLLDVKANLKAKQPKFIRQDAHKKKKLASKWRRPTGLHNKIGDNRKGYRKNFRGGYQTPVAVRGMTKEGLLPVVVNREADLADLNSKEHILIVSRTLGGKKKVALIEAGLKAGFTFQNASKERADKIKAAFESQSKEKKAREQEREKKHKELEKEAEKAEKEAEEENSEEESEKPEEPKPTKQAPVEKPVDKKAEEHNK